MTPTNWGRIGPITNNADTTTADVYVYDEIGYWGTEARAFAKDISGLDVDTLTVHINSPGGDAFAGVAIMNALRDHTADVHVIVDGLAASAASIIAMAGDTITMNLGSQMMVHDASTHTSGNSAAHAKAVTLLDKISDSIAEVYAARTGGTSEEWRAIMREETWYSAAEAVEAGLADTIDTATKAQLANDSIVNRFPNWEAANIPAEPETNGGTMAAIPQSWRDRLGLAETATEEEVNNALDKLLGETEKPKIQVGVTMIEDSVLDQLRADAAAGREAREAQIDDRRQRTVENAIKAGKIAPSRRDHWLAAIEADEEGATATLNALAPGLIPVTALGTEIDEADGVEDAEYFAVYPEGGVK